MSKYYNSVRTVILCWSLQW